MTGTSTTKKKAPRARSPFRNEADLRNEITSFINRFKGTVSSHGKRISDYFEMSCYNQIVKFYELRGYTVQTENLQSGQYRYKLSPAGIQSNFSHFSATKTVRGETFTFEIHHNLAVQSSHDAEIFTTPDITVVDSNSVKISRTHYDTKKPFWYVNNNEAKSFGEVKQYNPFPELIFNFIGIVNELRKEIMNNTAEEFDPVHIAPSLMISGKPNKPVLKIKQALEQRYCINIIYDLFYFSTRAFSKQNITQLRKAGRIARPVTIDQVFQKRKRTCDQPPPFQP